MKREIIVEVKNIHKKYKKRKSKEIIKAVDGVSFNVYKGEILGLLGPNGAGKTTTIKTICGLLKANEGEVFINGVDVRKDRLQALQYISAVLEGNRNLYWRLTARENLEYFAGNRGASRKSVQGKIDQLLKQFNLKDKENEIVSNLSRGMQQKLAIAVALLADSEVLLLDEPTLGLDVETSYEVREILKDIVQENGKTIIISTHDMPVVQDLCERTVIINKGKVVADEKVENLIKLFETSAYSFTLGTPLTEKQIQKLDQTFPIYEYSEDELKVTMEQEDDFYKMMKILQSEATKIEKIDRATVDFEQAFLKLIKEGEEDVVVS